MNFSAYIGHMNVDEAIQEIIGLSAQEKLKVVSEIWNTISLDNSELEVPELHRKILDKRLADHHSNSDTNLSIEDFKSELENDLQNNS